MPTRDDFSPAIKTLLKERVAGICSRPDCRSFTLGAHTDPGQKISIGVAAHICAAAPGGPRYDDCMPPAERAAAANGIWLCQSCSRLIDRDTTKYTIDVLRQWKSDAEARALRDIGKRVPSPDDARDQMVMALSKIPVSNQPSLIGNAHAAYEAVLEKADDRFVVKTSFSEGHTVIALHPKVPVAINFSVEEPTRSQWRQGLAAFWNHGETARLPGDGVRVHGSPLFDGTLSPNAIACSEIVISRDGVDVVAKVSLTDPTSKETFLMDDILGKLTGGKETFSFHGSACSGLVRLDLRQSIQEIAEEGDFTIGVNLTPWVGRDISKLPYFERLRQLYKLIVEGWTIDLTMELEGQRILGANVHVSTTNSLVLSIHTILEYTNRARILAGKLGQRLTFQLHPAFSAEDHEDLDDMASIAQGTSDLTADEVDNITASLIVGPNADNIRFLKESTTPHVMLFTANPDPLMVFGQPVVIPEVRKLFSGVIAQIDADINSLQEGETIPVRWVTAPGFTLSYSFEPADAENDPLRQFKAKPASSID